jgi:hypothetical protein
MPENNPLSPTHVGAHVLVLTLLMVVRSNSFRQRFPCTIIIKALIAIGSYDFYFSCLAVEI